MFEGLLDDRSYNRLQAICCRFWGIAPPQFEEWAEAGEITFEHVTELLELLGHEHIGAAGIFEYAFPEANRKQAERENQRKHVINSARNLAQLKPKNAAEAARKTKMLEEVHQEWERLKT